MSENAFAEEVKTPELIFGLVGPIGVNMDDVQARLSEALHQVGYGVSIIHITQLLKRYQQDDPTLAIKTAYSIKIDSANSFCRSAKNGAALAGLAISEIIAIRKAKASQSADEHGDAEKIGLARHAYIIRQLKREDEIKLLKRVYGQKFLQVSITLEKESRIRNLVNKLSTDHRAMKQQECTSEARRLIEIDENEEESAFGQQLGEIFHLGDFFVNSSDSNNMSMKCQHFIRAFFGDNSKSPNRDEFGAYTAASASLRSGDLSRQVGAAIFTELGDVIALGCNEVPKYGGGNYWYGDDGLMRDYERGAEQNGVEKQRIIMDSLLRLQKIGLIPEDTNFESEETKGKLKEAMDESLISDITEYGRMTHAEMSAICDAARLGRALAHSTIYVTTFPCHNWALLHKSHEGFIL